MKWGYYANLGTHKHYFGSISVCVSATIFLEITEKYLLGVVRFVAVFAVTQKDAITVQSPLAVVGLFHLNHWTQILAQRPEGLFGSRPTTSEDFE